MRDGQSITPLAMTMMMNDDRDDIKSPKEEEKGKERSEVHRRAVTHRTNADVTEYADPATTRAE
jgi:hypothetical protein